MKKLYLILVVAGLISMFFSAPGYAAKRKSKGKPVVLTTMDVKEAYEVIGIATYRSSSTSINDLIKGLENAARSLKADAVMGIRCVGYGDYFYAYGTAVKFKK